MQTIEINNQRIWDDFVTSVPPNSFFQSWNWGEVQQSVGNTPFRIGIHKQGRLVAVTLAVLMHGKKGSFLHLRHGPVLVDWTDGEIFNALLEKTKEIAQEKRVDFIRVSPLILHTERNLELFEQYGFRESSLHIMDAVYDWVLDLTPSEENILRGMRKTTRNLIGRARREGVTVRSTSNPSDLQTFHRLHHETMRRQRYASYPDTHLTSEFTVFSRDDQALLLFADYRGEPIATAMMIYYGNQAFYHWAGRSLHHQKIPASYLLQWESIRHAKRRGLTTYNFWGIAPDDNPKHPWAGLTLFKKGFGGRLIHYLHAHDLPLTKRYWVTFVAESVRRWQRGL